MASERVGATPKLWSSSIGLSILCRHYVEQVRIVTPSVEILADDASVATIVQFFFCWRIYKLAGSLWLPIVIAFVSRVSSSRRFVGSLTSWGADVHRPAFFRLLLHCAGQ